MTIKSYPARKAFVTKHHRGGVIMSQEMRADLDSLIKAEKAEAVAPLVGLLNEWLTHGRFLAGNSPEKADLVARSRAALEGKG